MLPTISANLDLTQGSNYMIFYHGTSKENWAAIQQEGFLYGRRYITGNNGKILKEVDRCTYLTTDLEEANYYGKVVLQVEYDPKSSKCNNYVDGCWQLRVYEPIPLSKIKLLNTRKEE